MDIKKYIFTLLSVSIWVLAANADDFARGKQTWENAYRNRQFSWAQNDFRMSISDLEEGVKDGYGEAAYMLGLSYLNEYGVDRDIAKAKTYFEKGLELGYEKGNLELGDILVSNSTTIKDGVDAWKKAYAFGEYGAVGRNAMAEYYGFSGSPNEDKAFEIASENLKETAEEIYNGWQLAMLGDFMRNENGRYPISKPTNLINKSDRINEAAALYYQSDIPMVQLIGAKLLIRNNIDNVRPKLKGNGGAPIYVMQMLRGAMRDTTANVGGEASYLYAEQIVEKNNYGELNDSYEKMNYGYGLQDAMLRAAELGYQPAIKKLAVWYETGMYMPKNLVKAKEWKEKAGINEEVVEIDESDEIFENPEVPAVFAEGKVSFKEWLKANKNDLGNADGTVKVSYIVEKDGSVSDPEIIQRSSSPDHNREALRLAHIMPKFTAAKNNGKAVRCRRTMTLVFKLMVG